MGVIFTVSFSVKYIHNCTYPEIVRMCRFKGPYSGRRPAVCADLKVRKAEPGNGPLGPKHVAY